MNDAVAGQKVDATLFGCLLLGGLSGSLLGMPWSIAIRGDRTSVLISVGAEYLLFLAPAAAVATWLGKRVCLCSDARKIISGKPTGWGQVRLGYAWGLLIGVVVGVLGFLAQQALPNSALIPGLVIPNTLEWFLRCLSAALTEEIFFRSGLMTLIVWLLVFIAKRPSSRTLSLWIGNLVSALLFAGAHLTQLTPSGWSFLIPVVVVSSGAGVVMGWLYMRYGLIAAVVAHFTGDFVVYVVPRVAATYV